ASAPGCRPHRARVESRDRHAAGSLRCERAPAAQPVAARQTGCGCAVRSRGVRLRRHPRDRGVPRDRRAGAADGDGLSSAVAAVCPLGTAGRRRRARNEAGVRSAYPGAMHATVLVVDDDESIRDLLCQVLRMSEFDVLGADTGLAALAVVEHRPVDLMVLDVMLPDLDGFAVARRLRAAGNRVPVLFLTARDTVQDRIIGLRAGGDDYVSKPFSLEEVVLRVQAIL